MSFVNYTLFTPDEMMGRIKFIFVLLAAALSSVTGLYTWNQRIASGGLASKGQFPYVVSITENDRHFCGGFIYSSQWVVTAASCLEGKSVSALNIVAGQLSTTVLDVNEQIVDVDTVTTFPEYNSTDKLNDIALIRLTTDIQFDNVYVDFILHKEASSGVGLVMGWGATFEGGKESISLHYGAVVTIPIDVSSTCGNFTSAEFDLATTICASGTVGS